MPRKIDYAVQAAHSLIQHLHCGGDRGAIMTFDHGYRVQQSFTNDEPALHACLDRVQHDKLTGGTRLYDSLIDAVDTFRARGDRTRPWFLVVVTDGRDMDSKKYNASSCGHEVMSKYNCESSNFVFVVGVGDDVDERALSEMGSAGGFNALQIDAFPLLEMVFMRIAFQVTNQLQGTVITDGEHTWTALQQRRQLSHNPMDYAFLIDVSGSMTDEVHKSLTCFSGHKLSPHSVPAGRWSCDRCGSIVSSSRSEHHCDVCNFDACPKCTKDVEKLEPLTVCRNRHPLRYLSGPSGGPWRCDECGQMYAPGLRLRCPQCNYDECEECLRKELLGRAIRQLL